MLAQQLDELIGDEGLRLVVYDDATGRPIGRGVTLSGHPSIGYGRALDVHGISKAEAQLLLTNDIRTIERALVATYPWFLPLDPVRQGVLTNLAYNLGLTGLASFHFMLSDLAAGDYRGAADELLSSRWARQVQASRSARLIEQLRTGTINTGGDDVSGFTGLPNTILAGRVGVDIQLTIDPQTRALLGGILSQLQNLSGRIDRMSGTQDSIAAELANLQASVQQAVDTETKAVALIQGIPALIDAAVAQAAAGGATPEQLQAFADLKTQLDAASQPLAAAVASQSPQPTPTP